jgi:hypothetical protein
MIAAGETLNAAMPSESLKLFLYQADSDVKKILLDEVLMN